MDGGPERLDGESHQAEKPELGLDGASHQAEKPDLKPHATTTGCNLDGS